MEKKLDLNFCKLFYSLDDKNVLFEKNILIQAYNTNKDFAKIKIPIFDVKLIYSRKEFDEILGYKSPDYAAAFAKDDNVFIFGYGVFEQETIWKKEDFLKTLIHELNHLFYQELRDDEYDPLWLSEGLATFMQHNKKKFNYKKILKIDKKTINQHFEEMTIDSYQIFTMFVEYLILEFGEKKILKLIEGLKGGENIDNLFKCIYDNSFDELIENGNKYNETT